MKAKRTILSFLIALFALIIPAAGVCASTPQDGSYYLIASALNTNYVMNVYGGGIADETNIQMYKNEYTTNEGFYLQKVDGKWFKIVGLASNSAVDIYGNGGAKKDNLQICKYHGGYNQQFCFESAGNDYYYIRSRDGKYLDVSGGQIGNGANVIAYSYHGGTNQKWRFIKVTASPYMSVPEGTYTIHSNLNKSLVTDVEGASTADGTALETWPSNGGNHQKVNIVRNGSYYSFIDVNSNKAIDVDGNIGQNGRKIQIWPRNSSNAQKFRFRSTLYGDGTFFIEHTSGYVWDVPNGSTKQGTKIVLWGLNKGNNQKWYLERTTARQPDPVTYYVTTKSGLNMRSGPSTGYPKVTSIPYAASITVYSISSGWARCSYGGKTGYVSTQYISTSKPSTTETYYIKTSTGVGVNMRSGPSTGYPKLTTIPYGAAVTVYSISGDWAKCSYGGKTGYCSSQYLTKTKPGGGSSGGSYSALSQALYKSSGAYISCGFDGYTTTQGRHEGIDMAYRLNAPVYALVSGTITRVSYGYSGTNGLSTVAIYDSSANKTVVYLHMNPLSGLKAGQYISKGQQIGTQGWRGVSSSSGSHTHVEVRNGKVTAAAKSLKDYRLDNPNPTSYWNSKGYSIR